MNLGAEADHIPISEEFSGKGTPMGSGAIL